VQAIVSNQVLGNFLETSNIHYSSHFRERRAMDERFTGLNLYSNMIV